MSGYTRTRKYLSEPDFFNIQQTWTQKISSNLRIGIFCDVTAYRISLFGACFKNFYRDVNLSVTQPPFNSKQKQNNSLWILWKIKMVTVLHETFQNIGFNVGIEAKNDHLNIPIFRFELIYLKEARSSINSLWPYEEMNSHIGTLQRTLSAFFLEEIRQVWARLNFLLEVYDPLYFSDVFSPVTWLESSYKF